MLLNIQTKQKRQVIDITEELKAAITGSGLVNLFIRHTTAAITTADLDPGTDQDYLKAIEQMTASGPWGHPHNPSHFPDHFWSTLIGANLTVPFEDGKMLLGQWQRVVLIELDGPRNRQVEITVIKN